MHKHVFVIIASGFLLSVNSQIDPDACGPGRIKDLHEDFGTISISYTFDSNVRCQWHVFPSIETTTKVAVVTVENVQFDSTECKQSYLQLFDNVDTDDLMDNRCEPATTARDAYTRISKSSSFTVKFLDNSGGWVGELVMHFEFIEASSDTTACGFGGPLRLTHQQGDITIPGPDLSFPINNIKCSWRIEGEGDEYVHLTLLSNSVMRAGDSATLYDGRNNRSTVLTSWNEDTELPAVKWNGGPYMYVEVDLGSAEDSVYPVVKFNFKSIKTYEWACNRTSDQGAPAYLTQVNDIILELPDYDVIGRIALNCRWSIVSHPGWIVSASVHNFTLGTQSETCGPNAAPLLTIGPEPESYLCGLVGSALHNHSFPALDVTLDLPVATRLETDYYIMKTSGQNITELACEDPYDALLTEQPGIISNTDSPHATADVHKCVWNLEAPEGWIVRLKVLEYSADCSDSACGFYIYESNDLLEFIHKSVVTEQSIYSSSNLMKIQYICSCSSPIRYFLYFSFHRATESRHFI
ncbi:hypothetical protein CAPTEDRAFT_220608 [Capitella teleta]|uniref:CUB domain-containing protein n=1 Tax=Capitella teleta TaxID=283909 RepID=R7U269_CAPTE|nr:hypothetical protein CAPTEDRAFT_220608 [Capitella teleta]|eukprot:ELU00415.1 hypothetical protein CAPTEDRAFT_220608 [Capitella teleta]